MAAIERQKSVKKDEVEMAVVADEDDEHGCCDKLLLKYFLIEWKLIKKLLDGIVLDGRVSDLSTAHQIRSILDKYQFQGQLLEPYLETIVSPLMFIIRSRTVELGVETDEILEVIKPICIIIYCLVTVCGYKAVTKFFPHQVSDLELAVSLLEKCHNTDSVSSLRQESTGEMEAKCVVLLWLSILVLVPFDISSVDSSIGDDSGRSENEPAPLVLRILGFSKDYLCSAGPMRKIAGLLLSKLLTRPDMPKAFTSFIEWTHEVLSSEKDDIMHHFRLLGATEALAAIFKAGDRKLLRDVVSIVWNDITFLRKTGTTATSPLLRKYLVKLTQRIGVICLPHRAPSWRYVGRTIYLGEKISANAPTSADQSVSAGNSYSESEQCQDGLEDEDIDVPEIIEEMIEMLLSGLRDTDTVVRWSAAKGIGRVTSQLTPSLSEEVLSSVLELFSPGEGDSSWHGGCLALAELARRGLLLPQSLPNVVPVIVKALHYDVRRGPHSVGSHVRDAAAYVCWAFGRAYYHTDMRHILEQLAPHLLTVACYDREVNCRRAAAAAFQENVGRQGNYPHGIDIVTLADYFSLSSRINSYLQVAVDIAQYEGYLQPFVDDLLFNKICHWEKGLRELAAEALAALVKYNTEYFANSVLEKLLPCTLSSDLCMRHGATLAAGEVALALHRSSCVLSADKQKAVAGIVPAIEKARLYRGKGGEIMRSAVSRFIECISLSGVALSEKVKHSLLESLNENLRHPNSQIQNAAVNALKPFVRSYFVSSTGGDASNIVSKYLELLSNPNVAVRRGSALALGVLPYESLASRWKDVLLKLCSACLIEENPEERDAEARVNAVKGLVCVCETLTQAREDSKFLSEGNCMSIFHLIKKEVMNSLLKALDDYSVDNRGDVGSWVREAAMDSLERCAYILCKKDLMDSSGNSNVIESGANQPESVSSFFDLNLATSLVGGILKQAVEKIDKLREAAANILRRILYQNTVFVPFIPHREKLEEIVPNEESLEWGVPIFSYPRFLQLLKFSCYSKAVLSGLVIAVGGLQDSLRKISLSALLEYLQMGEAWDLNERKSRECMLWSDILWVLQEYKKCDRVIIPNLKVIEILFSKKLYLNIEAHDPTFYAEVVNCLTIELKASKDFTKLYAGIAILGYIASVSAPINTRAFSHLLTFLGHRYPKIRKAAAEQVYLVLLQNGSLVAAEKMEKALEIIAETCWEGDIVSTKPQRLELCELTGLDVPLLLKSNNKLSNKPSEKRPMPSDENASYASLVDSSGF